MKMKWKQRLAMMMALCMLATSVMPTGSQTVYASTADAVSVEETEQGTDSELEETSDETVDPAVAETEATGTEEGEPEAATTGTEDGTVPEMEAETAGDVTEIDETVDETEVGAISEDALTENQEIVDEEESQAETVLSETGEVTIESIEVVTFPSTVYYCIDHFYIGDAVFLCTFSDGSSIQFSLWDETWYAYGLHYSDSGSGIYDDAGYCPVGEYEFVIYGDDVEYLSIPYSVVYPDDITILEENMKITGLSVDDYHYFKLQVEEGVYYKLTVSATYRRLSLTDQDFNWIADYFDDGSHSFTFKADYTGSYYVSISAYSNFDLSMESAPAVESVEVVTYPRTTYYYKLDESSVSYMVNNLTVQLTFDDGTIDECSSEDSIWDLYRLECEHRTADGDYITYDSDGYQPTGEYQLVIYVDGTAYTSIPFTVLPPENIDLELEDGDTLSNLSGTGNNEYYWNQYCLKLQLEEGVKYKVISSIQYKNSWC